MHLTQVTLWMGWHHIAWWWCQWMVRKYQGRHSKKVMTESLPESKKWKWIKNDMEANYKVGSGMTMQRIQDPAVQIAVRHTIPFLRWHHILCHEWDGADWDWSRGLSPWRSLSSEVSLLEGLDLLEGQIVIHYTTTCKESEMIQYIK